VTINSAGTISGTPTATGTFNVVVTSTDAAGAQDTQTINGVVINGALSITGPATLPGGVVNTAYTSTTVTAAGGTTPRTFSATGLPAGMSINSGSGAISGTPTAAGSASVVVTVTDAAGATASQGYTFGILGITGPATMPNWTVGQAYPSQTVIAVGGTGATTWSISAGALPTGLTLNTSTGAVAGTPTVANTFNFTVRVADSASHATTKAYTVTINPALSVASSVSDKKNNFDVVVASGGTQPYSWSFPSGAPPAWMTFGSNGHLSGNPPATGTTIVRVTVTDSGGASTTVNLTVTVT